MKYITQVVEANNDIKHVVEVNCQSVFVLYKSAHEQFGNKKGGES